MIKLKIRLSLLHPHAPVVYAVKTIELPALIGGMGIYLYDGAGLTVVVNPEGLAYYVDSGEYYLAAREWFNTTDGLEVKQRVQEELKAAGWDIS